MQRKGSEQPLALSRSVVMRSWRPLGTPAVHEGNYPANKGNNNSVQGEQQRVGGNGNWGEQKRRELLLDRNAKQKGSELLSNRQAE